MFIFSKQNVKRYLDVYFSRYLEFLGYLGKFLEFSGKIFRRFYVTFVARPIVLPSSHEKYNTELET